MLSRIILRANPILKRSGFGFQGVRTHFNKDYKPKPYPKTQEERIKAAEKYGLHITEYKPYPDEGVGLGDYPDLPKISMDSKDPFYPYDNPELKRNFQEPMHYDFDLYSEDRYDISFRHRVPLLTQFFQLAGVLIGTFMVYAFLENMKMFTPTVPKQYPFQGKTHYTFNKESGPNLCNSN